MDKNTTKKKKKKTVKQIDDSADAKAASRAKAKAIGQASTTAELLRSKDEELLKLRAQLEREKEEAVRNAAFEAEERAREEAERKVSWPRFAFVDTMNSKKHALFSPHSRLRTAFSPFAR